jgi:hypothetical protein
MGVTVAPLTSAVMGSVNPSHAGVASGVNNAVSRAAGLLAIGVLGVLLFATFNRALDRELADLGLPPDVRALIDAQRGRLAAPALPPSLDGALAASIRSAFGHAYVSGFRALMITSAGLSILGALAAAAFIEPRVHVAPAVLGAASGERH